MRFSNFNDMLCIITMMVVLFTIFPLSSQFKFVTRQEWGARPPKRVQYFAALPIYTIVHHSYIPPACSNKTACINAMRWMQNFHMDDRKWDDIGYNFAIGNDCRVYEGRGWNTIGAHTKGYNAIGMGIVMIGDYRNLLPAECAIDSLIELIEYNVEINKTNSEFTLRGHRDFNPSTECPGQALYDVIQTWPHY